MKYKFVHHLKYFMEMTKKTTIIIGVVCLILIVAVVFIGIKLGSSNKESVHYPDKPMEQTALGQSETKKLDVSRVDIPKENDLGIYALSENLKVENMKTLASELNISLTNSEKSSWYQWGEDSGNMITYDLIKNIAIISIKNGMDFNQAEVTSSTFSNLVRQFFGEEWKYTVFKTEKRSTGETMYYAKRLLDNGFPIEMREHNQQTDTIASKNGKILFMKFMLTEFTKTDTVVPLINVSELLDYVNVKEYPKEIYPSLNTLQGNVLSDVNYLSDEFIDVAQTADNCKGSSSEIVYLYTSMKQKTLIPVYKIDAECSVKYKDEEYFVPAIAYVNAIDPKYISDSK